ncbi:MAG: NosD domain-containing protein [Candidatus Bathyarchaeales archaeon]
MRLAVLSQIRLSVLLNLGVKGIYYLKVNMQNLNNLRNTSNTFMIYIEGLDAALKSETDKKVYSLNENITIKTEIKNFDGLIQDATLNLQISGKKPCVIPHDDMYINEDTVLCPGTYSIEDKGTQGVLIINASNIVLDCNGAVLNGISKKGYGIISFGWNYNVTIKNCKIMNYDYGIYLSYAYNNVIMNNEIQDMDYYGIYLGFSSSNLVYNNTLTNCYYGIDLARGDKNIVLKNTLQSNRDSGIYVYTEEDDIIAKNTFTDNLYGIYFSALGSYYPNENITIAYNQIAQSSDTGIYMRYTSDSLILNNSITSNTYQGIYITTSQSNHNLILNNTIEKNRDGIYLYVSTTTTPPTNNVIDSNIIRDNTRNGVYLANIQNTTIINNLIRYNGYSGIYLAEVNSRNIIIANNTIEFNAYGSGAYEYYGGIHLLRGANNTIIGNTVKLNKYYGIYLGGAQNNTIANNTIIGNNHGIYSETQNIYPAKNGIYLNNIENNTIGIYAYSLLNSTIAQNIIKSNTQNGILLYSASGNIIVNNTITLNNNIGIQMAASASKNSIYHNNMISNVKQAQDSGSANTWDNGYPSGGNYWSDYTDVDQYSGPYQNESGSDGIWDHPYAIPYYSKDNYPFINPNRWTPFDISQLNMPNLKVTINMPNIPEDPSDPDPPDQGEGGIIWERNITVNVVNTLSLNTFVGQLGITGKYYLTARLYSSSTQMIAWDTDTFYITESEIYLTMKTDKKIYKPGENITISGEVINKGNTAKTLTLTIKKNETQIYSESFTLDPNSSRPYTLVTFSNTSFTLEGNVDGFAATEFIRIAEPKLNITLTVPDIVGREPFIVTLGVQNKGELPVNLNISLDGRNYAVIIPVNQTTLITTEMTITKNTTLAVTITGDYNDVIQKEIIFGENIQIAVYPRSFYLEGIVEIPYTLTNKGLLETSFNITFKLNGKIITKAVFLPISASLTDSISLNLTKGKYLLHYWTPFQDGNATITVETPAEFIIISLPENETFKLGQTATLTVTLKNIGGTAGTVQANMTVPGITEQTNSTFILPGREGNISFTFKVPEDLEEKYYKAFFEIEGEKYEVKFFVLGAKIAVNASLDKQLYEEGENATLTLNIENLRDMNLTLFSRVVFAGYELIQYFNLTSYEIKNLNFSVPIVFNAGKLSYSIYLTSGRALYINALYIYPKPPESASITIYTDKQVYETGETAKVYVNVTKQGTLIMAAPNLDINTTVSPGMHQFSFEIPKLKSGTYTIRYTFENYSSSYPIDVIGFSARIIDPELDKTTYSDGDIITMTLLIDTNRNFEGLVKAWIFDPENKIIGEGETNHTFTTGENKVKISIALNTNSTGLHAIAYVVYAYGSFIWLSSGSTYFNAEVTAQSDTTPPQIGYVDVTNALNENRPITVNEPIAINAIVTDNVKVEKVTLYYRKAGQQSYTTIVMTICPGCIDTYNATIPASQVTTATIEFYINATDGTNYSTYPAANPTTNPLKINVNLYPTPVVLDTPTEITENSMKLSWTQSIDTDFKNYTIYLSSTSGSLGTAIHTITQKSTTSYTVTGLTANTTYYFTIRVYDTGGLYADSNQVSARTLAATPTPPPPVNLPPTAVVLNPPTEITENSVKLSWTESVDTDFKNYTIYLSTTAGNIGTQIYAITTKSTTSYTVTGLIANTTYYFTIRVYDTGGLYADSNQVSAKTLETQQQPPPPPHAQFPWTTLAGVAAVALVIVIAAVIIRKRKGTKK